MLIVGMLTWWYGAGWRRQFGLVQEHADSLMDYFSIGLLGRTLFAPFRQISAGSVDGPLGVKLHAFFDKLISRVIGAVVRLIVIGIGTVSICLYLLVGYAAAALWAVVPALPLIGIVLAITGWMPWKV